MCPINRVWGWTVKTFYLKQPKIFFKKFVTVNPWYDSVYTWFLCEITYFYRKNSILPFDNEHHVEYHVDINLEEANT